MIEMNVDKMIFKWEHETVLSAFLNRNEAAIDTSEEIQYPIERLTDETTLRICWTTCTQTGMNWQGKEQNQNC